MNKKNKKYFLRRYLANKAPFYNSDFQSLSNSYEYKLNFLDSINYIYKHSAFWGIYKISKDTLYEQLYNSGNTYTIVDKWIQYFPPIMYFSPIMFLDFPIIGSLIPSHFIVQVAKYKILNDSTIRTIAMNYFEDGKIGWIKDTTNIYKFYPSNVKIDFSKSFFNTNKRYLKYVERQKRKTRKNKKITIRLMVINYKKQYENYGKGIFFTSKFLNNL